MRRPTQEGCRDVRSCCVIAKAHFLINSATVLIFRRNMATHYRYTLDVKTTAVRWMAHLLRNEAPSTKMRWRNRKCSKTNSTIISKFNLLMELTLTSCQIFVWHKRIFIIQVMFKKNGNFVIMDKPDKKFLHHSYYLGRKG